MPCQLYWQGFFVRNSVLKPPRLALYIRFMDAGLHDFVRIPTWPVGLKMLEKYSNELPARTKKMAVAHQNSLTLDILVKACKKIADSQPVPPAPKPRIDVPKAKNEHVKVSFRLPPDENLPADLVKLKGNVVAWLAEQRDIRGRLRQLAYAEGEDNGKAMYSLSAKIVRIETMLQGVYARLDYYERMKVYLPGTEPVPKQERMFQLLQRKQNNKDYIRRYGDSDKPKQQKQVVRRKNELAELKKLMDEKESK